MKWVPDNTPPLVAVRRRGCRVREIKAPLLDFLSSPQGLAMLAGKVWSRVIELEGEAVTERERGWFPYTHSLLGFWWP